MTAIYTAMALLLALGCTTAAAQQPPTADWCSAVAVRPDQRMRPAEPCVRIWSDLAVATRADVVLFGSFYDAPSSTRVSCGHPTTHHANRDYAAPIRALRPAGRLPIQFMHMPRFDLLSFEQMSLPGFDRTWLLTTSTTFADVAAFLAPAAWAPADGLDESHVYYVSLRKPAASSFRPHAVVADLTNSAYRAWRVGQAKQSLRTGDYDAVMIGEKFGQYHRPGYWMGSDWCPDVATCTGTPDTIWTAEPIGYGWAEYVAGWVALADDLTAAGVPFAVRLNPNPWLRVPDERVQIRAVLDKAELVLLDAANTYPDTIGEWTQRLRETGVLVQVIDSRCGHAT